MCYGISAALVYYSGPFEIFSRFRNFIASDSYFNELFSCMFCLPTNIGIVMSILGMLFMPFTPFTILFSGQYSMLWPLVILFDGFYTGAVVSIIDTVVERISAERVDFSDDSKKVLLND